MTTRSKLPLWVYVLVFWTAYGVIFAGQIVSMGHDLDTPIGWDEALRSSLGGWLTWVPLSLGLLWVVRRHPVQRGRIGRSLAVLALAVAVVVLLRATYVYFSNPWFGWYDVLPSFTSVLAASLFNNLLLGWLVVGLLHAFVFYGHAREREATIVSLEARLARARLEALSARLNPHFLFNSINAIAELVHSNPKQADAMLVGLAAMLRSSLMHDVSQEVELHSELELVRHYTAMQQIRLGDRLQMHWSVAPDTLDAFVPALLLQPLVENAFVHGLARRTDPGAVKLRTWRTPERLHISLANDGVPGDSAGGGSGIGLQNTRERLACLYGADFSLALARRPDGHTVVALDIPFRSTAVLPVRDLTPA